MKKNIMKVLSLAMALCLVLSMSVFASAASNEATANGGTATSNVTLSSTADSSLDGTPAATKMSVTVPTALPVAVGVDGTVTTATNAVITNNSYGAVKVSSVTIEAAQGWSLTAFGDKDSLSHEKVDANKIGFSLSLGDGEVKRTDAQNASSQALIQEAIAGCYMAGCGDEAASVIAIDYDAIVTPVSTAITNTGVANILFVIQWDV